MHSRIVAIGIALSAVAHADSPGRPTDGDRTAIRKTLYRYLPSTSSCYEKQRLNKPTLAGTVSATFVIDAAGAVSSIDASGVDPAVASCIADVVKKIVFAKPAGGKPITAIYEWTFRPPDAAT